MLAERAVEFNLAVHAPTPDKTSVRRLLLTALPKTATSCVTGWITRIPLPKWLRPRAYGWFARRYGAELDDVERPLVEFRSLAAFFSRPLRDGARPVGDTPLVWPCDGRIVTSGPIEGDAIPQIKGQTYALDALLGDVALADALRDGSQATIYLAPGDYHRVHVPFDGRLTGIRSIRGTLFPVNPPAVRAIPNLFVRNARRVFEFELADGRRAAVVMVGALNVGSIETSASIGSELARGDELGRFGFGSTTVTLIGPGEPGFPERTPETVVRTGGAIAP